MEWVVAEGEGGGVGMKKWGEVEKKTAGRKGMVEILARCNGVLKIDAST